MLFTFILGGDVLAPHSCALEMREGIQCRVEGTAAQGFQKLQLLYDAYKLDGEEKIALVQPSLDLAKDVMASLAPVASDTNATGEL